MTSQDQLKSVNEILGIAITNSGQSRQIAKSLPMPVKSGSELHVVVLFYREPLRSETVYPPRHMVEVNAVTGAVVRSKSVTPEDFGVDQSPDEPTQGFGFDSEITGPIYQTKKRRFYEISPIVWQAYGTGVTNLGPRTKELVDEHYSIFLDIAKRPLVPYYNAVANDFFQWTQQVLD